MRLFALIALASLSLSLPSHGFVVQPSIPTRNVATPSLKMAEHLLQYSRQREDLLANGIDLIMISIGKPEVGKKLIAHLELQDGEKYIFVDPENALYDDLDLRRGVKETFFSVSTPLSFLDRFTKKDGMKDLIEVLSKWNKAIYIPPKQEQAFLQGGTFIFDGPDTVYAHYDESTAAHASVDAVIELAMSRVKVAK